MPDALATAAGWPRLCRGEASSSFWSSTSSCANEPFDFRRYSSARRALDAYAAFHAAFNASPDARYLVFAPNQYGLGNRLRAMKSALLVAMLTGRVFRVRWDDPWPLADFVQHERIDWRLPDGGGGGGGAHDTAAAAARSPVPAGVCRSDGKCHCAANAYRDAG